MSEESKAVAPVEDSPLVVIPDPRAASSEFLARIPRDFARAHLVLSQGRAEGVERLAVSSSTKPSARFNVGVRLGVAVEFSIAEDEAIARAVDEAYAAAAEQASTSPGRSRIEVEEGATPQSLEALLAGADRDLLSTSGKGPVVKLVDALLFEALTRGASDLHIQPVSDRALVRYRVDGALRTARELSSSVAQAVTSRIKVMGRMDIAERRVAQDGRASVAIGERAVDLRISTFPTSYGERTVLRLLDPTRQLAAYEQLGMPADVREKFLAACQRASGLVLVTGPTGSGKTTTLYATIRRVASPDLNVMSIEDPIEYELATAGLAVSQSQVAARKGVTFASGLRHILRQDPDVVLVGEIRDAETARMAIQSSLTGHLVLSTLHTNDAPSAATRLVDLGVEPFLLAASLCAVLAQRLVRRRHSVCEGRGCEPCLQSGYLGRTGLFELWVVDEEMRSRIARGESVSGLRAAARAAGMRTLREEGARAIAAGVTDALEVERVVEEEA